MFTISLNDETRFLNTEEKGWGNAEVEDSRKHSRWADNRKGKLFMTMGEGTTNKSLSKIYFVLLQG